MTEETRTYTPDLTRLTQAADESFSVRRAFGDAYEHNGTVVVPVAKVWGATGTGAGGGTGNGNGATSATGTGNGQGRTPLSFSRSGSVRVSGGDAAGGEGGDPSTGTAGSDGDTRGEASGEARGEASGEARGEGGAGGGGFGVRVKALGVYSIGPSGDVRWQPALDLNRVVLGGQAVAAVAALALGWAVGRRRRSAH
ncbi:hypothetical protein [Cellulomonas sp. PhB143]|uniref:hypothetical protein n=1 Tax=Cellulomonas sp. PhB143 TaxID=2485186 RepID=UPI000F47C377|nr:hypothetical protein [Cellulomonas sp. PhB143]ROS77238.1 hypothetical protein EDF32_1236 [Cellulomonas sp. PhB143]